MQMLLGKKVLFHGQHALNVHLLQYSLKKKDRNGVRYLSCFYYKVYRDRENHGKQRLQSVLVIGLQGGKANAIDKWRPYSLCSEKTMKNGSSYVSRPPYATMRQLFDYRGQPCSQGSLLPEPRNEVVLEGGWDISKENLANSSCVRVRVLFLCLNPKNKKKSDGR